jgi:hypothetical protein
MRQQAQPVILVIHVLFTIIIRDKAAWLEKKKEQFSLPSHQVSRLCLV